MPKQLAFPGLRDAMNKKVTRRELFLAEMDAVVPWTRLLALIEPHYPKAAPKGGRPPLPLETILRVYFLQNGYALSDPMVQETLYDSEAMRRFAGIELGDDRNPDETSILNFRHLLERHRLTEALFADVNAHLSDKGITLRSGTLVDATIIGAPSSTKNKAGARDPPPVAAQPDQVCVTKTPGHPALSGPRGASCPPKLPPCVTVPGFDLGILFRLTFVGAELTLAADPPGTRPGPGVDRPRPHPRPVPSSRPKSAPHSIGQTMDCAMPGCARLFHCPHSPGIAGNRCHGAQMDKRRALTTRATFNRCFPDGSSPSRPPQGHRSGSVCRAIVPWRQGRRPAILSTPFLSIAL